MEHKLPDQALQALEKKIHQLLEHYKKQRDIIKKLQKENKQLQQRLAKQEKIEKNSTTLADGALATLPETEKKELRDKVHAYIQYIDACIAQFEKRI